MDLFFGEALLQLKYGRTKKKNQPNKNFFSSSQFFFCFSFSCWKSDKSTRQLRSLKDFKHICWPIKVLVGLSFLFSFQDTDFTQFILTLPLDSLLLEFWVFGALLNFYTQATSFERCFGGLDFSFSKMGSEKIHGSERWAEVSFTPSMGTNKQENL